MADYPYPPANAAVELTRQLVQSDTRCPPGRELELVRLLEERLSTSGFECVVVPYLDEEARPDRAHLVARKRGNGSRPGLLFSGHIDVVPPGEVAWTVDPFGGTLVDGRIYGRGACDMKGGVAALVVAAEALARTELAGDLVVAVTADEERNCLGAEALVKAPLFAGLGAAIVAEPTSLRLVVAEKGALWVRMEARGRTAHGSMPELGANAVSAMAEFLYRWEQTSAARTETHDILGKPTLTVGLAQGGVKTNVVPDRCIAELDLRTVPGMSHAAILAEIDALAAEIAGRRPGVTFTRKVLSDRAPVGCPPESALCLELADGLRALSTVDPTPGGVPYCTEACIWVPELGIPAVICGPSAAGMAHQPDEYGDAAEIELAARLYARAAARLIGIGG